MGVTALYRNSKQAISNFFTGLKCLGSKQQKQVLIIGMALGAANLALSLFTIYTLVSLGLLFGAIGGLIAIKLITIKRNGVINYIPIKYHNVLLNRSIFDIVCDLWFEPKIILYVKAFVLPFLVKVDPAEAIEQFNDFPPHLRDKLLTKGLVNLMPGFIRNAVNPPGENISDSPSEPSSLGIEEEELMENRYEYAENGIRERKTTKNNEILSDTRSAKTTATSCTPRRVIDLTDENSSDPLAPFKNNKNALITKNTSNKSKNEDSTKAESIKLAKGWDRLEEFIRKNREKIIKERMGLIPPKKTFELKGPLSKIQNLALTLNSANILDRLNGKALTALFLISGVGVMSQMILSKRTRLWTVNLLYFLAYAAGISVSSGSFVLLLLKLKAKLSKKKGAIKAN